MMRWMYLIIIFSLGTLQVVAQNNDTLPVFSELLRVELGYPIMDNEARLVYRYEQNGKIEFAFPDEVYQFTLIMPQDETSWLLIERTEEWKANLWQLNWQTGEFSPLNQLCGSELNWDNLVPGNEAHETMVFMQEDSISYLCYLPSGERIELPGVSSWTFLGYGDIRPSVSPDGRYIITIGYEQENERSLGSFLVYSFDTSTQELLLLGEMPIGFNSDIVSIESWIDERYFSVYQGGMPEWSSRYIYVADASRENSLNFGLRGWRYRPVYHDNPPQFEYMISVVSDGPTPGPCILAVYDIYSNTYYEYDTGSFCDYGWIVPNGNSERIYRAYYPQAGVVSFNPITGVQRVIYIGEVEGIYGLSPDGHYALIGLDDAGVVSNPQDVYDIDIDFVPTEYFVLDLLNGGIVATVPTTGQWISGNVYLSWEEEQSYLYIMGETTQTLALGSTVLDISSDGNVYVFNAETETISFFELETQTFSTLVSNLNGWTPMLAANEAGFSLSLADQAGQIQAYRVFWP